MNISIDILSERLGRYDFVQVCGRPAEPTLESTRLLHRNIEKFEERYLYIGIPEDIDRLRLSIDMRHITIICCGIPDSFDTISPDSNFYYIGNEVDFGLFYNEVEDVFSYYREWEKQLKHICESKGSLQQMINVSDEIFPYPIALVDGAERTIAYSMEKDCDDLVWQYIKEGYIRTEYLLRDNVHSKDILHYRAPKQLYTTASNRYVMLQPVIVHYHTVAFVSLMMVEAGVSVFSRGTEQLMMVLTREIANRMEQDEFYGLSMGVAVEFFLADLISGKVTDTGIIQDRAAFLELDIYARRRIFCICYEKEEMLGARRRKILEAAKRLFPDYNTCFYEGNAVFIERQGGILESGHGMDVAYGARKRSGRGTDDGCGQSENRGIGQERGSQGGVVNQERDAGLEFHKNFLEWLEKERMLCGISMQFDSLYEMASFYVQAKEAMKLGRVWHPGRRVYYYDAYIMQHGLEMLERQTNLRDMIHPVVWKILEQYGEEHYMLATVRAYLLYDKNISVAAKRLHVHRNTMLYRIEQLTDKLGHDFADAEECLQIIYSIEIVEYLQKKGIEVAKGR